MTWWGDAARATFSCSLREMMDDKLNEQDNMATAMSRGARVSWVSTLSRRLMAIERARAMGMGLSGIPWPWSRMHDAGPRKRQGGCGGRENQHERDDTT